MKKQNRKARRKDKIKKDLLVPTTEWDEIIRFARTLGIVILILVVAYFFTRIFVTRDLFNRPPVREDVVTIPDINYDVMALRSMFTRPYKEYYVLIYSSEHRQANFLSILASTFRAGEDAIKLYFADLNSPFNRSFHSEESNPKATSALDLKVGDTTLIKIRDGRIVRFIENIDDITKELEVNRWDFFFYF